MFEYKTPDAESTAETLHASPGNVHQKIFKAGREVQKR